MTTHVTTVSFAQGTAPVGDTAVFEIFIKATPERVWEAITDPVQRGKYSFGVQTRSDWATGSTYTAGVPGVVDMAEGASRVTWEIEQVEDSCRLTVTHDQLREGANNELYGGWPMILSGLKTLLETGELLTTPGSLMYGHG